MTCYIAEGDPMSSRHDNSGGAPWPSLTIVAMTEPLIRQLPEVVANKIAAGEVIERPAAVVKELVENSLDAGAGSLVVRIEDGGRRLVEVVDDGAGMSPADLRLALCRHATSKLRTADDLFHVATLGFRGEALPSIAAVSEFDLASRPPGSAGGHHLAVAGGRDLADEPCALAPGTRVSVRNLFWNVPVRLKFLKARGTETGHVTDMLTRLALGHPHIAFRLEVDGRATIDLPAEDTLPNRVRSLFGKQLAGQLLEVIGHAEGTQLTGYIAHPSQARPSTKRQFVFLNGRHVRDKLLVAAIREGFRGHLEPRLHGAVFLHLDMDPGLVDVNVHPTKAEVRFRREKDVFHLLRAGIADCLDRLEGAFGLLRDDDQPAATPTPTRVGAPTGRTLSRTVVKEAAPPPVPEPAPIQERYLPPTPAAASDRRVADAPPEEPEATAEAAGAALPGVRQIVQLRDSYLLVETDAGLRIVDQHALHEKALYLALGGEHGIDLAADGREEYLVPKTIELTATEVAAVEPHLPHLAARGIEAEVFGPTSLLLRAAPAALATTRWQTFFQQLADEDPDADALDRLRDRLAHRRACRAAVKAGEALSPDEQRELVSLLYRVDGVDHCPHGRPTTLDLSWQELEKRFMR